MSPERKVISMAQAADCRPEYQFFPFYNGGPLDGDILHVNTGVSPPTMFQVPLKFRSQHPKVTTHVYYLNNMGSGKYGYKFSGYR